MTRTIRLLPLLTAVVLLGAGQARAEMVAFSYQWSVQPSVIPAGTGVATFAAAPDDVASVELGSMTPAFIPGSTATTTSSAPPETPDVFNSPFGMTLKLTDTASGQFGELTFSGALSGKLTATGSPPDDPLKATFDDPFTKTLTLGDLVYSVTIDPTLVNLPAPGATSQSLIGALVTVAPKDGDPPPPTHNTPEPTSLVLGATAVLGLALRRAWRRRLSPRQA
jgi:hypothetical protein